jgi:hypothetical protein
MSFSHTDADIEHTLASYKEVLQLLAEAVQQDKVSVSLKGKPVEAVFRKVSHFNTKPVLKTL